MLGFFRHNIATATCWYCNEKTQLDLTKETTSNWHCTKCDNQNILNEEGSIVDSRPEMYRVGTSSKNESPSLEKQRNQVFCDVCQRNQELVYQILAAYLPDEDSPDYSEKMAGIDGYIMTLEQRYPPVCTRCQVRVDRELQSQSHWLHTRELANALTRSYSARRHEPRISLRPSLRRKRVLFGWLTGAAFGLVLCPILMWIWYLLVFTGVLRSENSIVIATGVFISLATYFTRMLNPRWLDAAGNPGLRVVGLDAYKTYIRYLAAIRLGASASAYTNLAPPVVFLLFLIADVILFVCALVAPHAVHRGRYALASRSGEDQSEAVDGLRDESANNSNNVTSNGEVFSALSNLSLGASEINKDQDDSFWGIDDNLLTNSQRSGESAASLKSDNSNLSNVPVDIDSLSMGTKYNINNTRASQNRAENMDIDQQPLGKSTASRPFQTLRFGAQKSTGLESVMGSFSLDDGGGNGTDSNRDREASSDTANRQGHRKGILSRLLLSRNRP